MGYRFQFITLAGFHALNASMFELARGYAEEGMSAYVRLQEREFAMEDDGYTATRHQAEVGTGYFDRVAEVISNGTASTLALRGLDRGGAVPHRVSGDSMTTCPGDWTAGRSSCCWPRGSRTSSSG